VATLGLLWNFGLMAEAVTFQFTGQLTQISGPGAGLISNTVGVGMLCSGTISYDPQAASAEPHDPGTEAYYDFNGSTMAITLNVGTNVFTSTNSSSCQVEVIYKMWSPTSDGLSYQALGVLLNGAQVPGATDSQTLTVELLTTNLAALSSDALPTKAPQFDSFIVAPGSGYRDMVFYTYKGGSFDYGIYAVLASITGPPLITGQPQNQSVLAGKSTSFNVTAVGILPLSYQWRLNGTSLSGATNSTYTVAYVLPLSSDPSALANYDVVVTNVAGSITSQVATLTVSVPPYIATQPQSQALAPFQNATFSVTAGGAIPLSYKWRHNGVALNNSAATTPTNTIVNAQWSDAGTYDVVITNAFGSITSEVAVLLVRDLTQPAISVPGNIVTPCTGPGGAPVSFSVSATDIYTPASHVLCTPPSGSIFPIGLTAVNCVATDAVGNTNTASFTVQVTGACDAGYIAIHCPTNIQVTLGALPTVSVAFDVTATNLFTGQAYPVHCSPPSGSSFPVGTNLITCVASAGGASAVCTFQVIVTDATPPQVWVPRSISAFNLVTNALGQIGAYVNFQANAADNSGVVLSYSSPPGGFFAIGTSTVTCVARDASGNATTSSFTVSVEPAPGPLGGNADNWGFENAFFTGWTASGGEAFTYQPVTGDYFTVKRIPELRQQLLSKIGGDYWTNLYYSVGQRGSNWICTAYVPEPGPGGNLDSQFDDTLAGTLLSKPFTIQTDYITFLIGGGQDGTLLRVELLVQVPSNTPGAININGLYYTVFDWRTGHGRELMRREWWSVASQRGQSAYIRILDNSTAGHLNVDDFQFQNVAPTAATVTLGTNSFPAVVASGGYYYDWDSPVWGFADLHTHPMSYLGFGQKLMHGQPDGGAASPADFTNALANCRCDHEGWGLDNPCGDYFRQLVMHFTDDGGLDPHGEGWDADPWKQFRNWPVFTTLSHQQMWFEWIKRAYDGGERVMVALCVNNRLLATASKGNPAAPHDDKAVGDLQIPQLKNFVARHSDFMEIAYDPWQLRDIVRRNKLAIIIGSELDDIGDFVRDPTVADYAPNSEFGGQLDQQSKDKVRQEIQRLYDQGLRYIFPVHLTDNKFGGTAPGGDVLNIASKFSIGSGFQVQWAAPGDHIHYWLSSLDLTMMLPQLSDNDRLALADLIIFAGPILPALEPALEQLLPNLAPAPPGTGGAAALGLLPIVAGVVMAGGTDGLLRSMLTFAGLAPTDIDAVVNARILPLPGNYPTYPSPAQAQFGVRNVRSLTDLGQFAVKEMMRLGMMIDVDHMSQNTLDAALDIATNVPGGYPLNFGHNGFRDLGLNGQGHENSRSSSQVRRLAPLGGLMGVGWEDAKDGNWGLAFGDLVPAPQFSSSAVANDCAGTSKTWAQSFLYALEQLQGQNVALGTDASGFIQFPGPRFGPQSAYGLDEADMALRSAQIEAQANGVLYGPSNGPALTTPAFRGRAVETDNQTAFASTWKGYEYNLDQADFYAAINIFYWLQPNAAAWDQTTIVNNVNMIATALSDNYPDKFSDLDPFGGSRVRIADYAAGLLGGINNHCFGEGGFGSCGWDATPDKNARQQFGKAVYRNRVLGENLPSGLTSDRQSNNRLNRLLQVWDQYQRVFGHNAPMKRCQTDFKQWDINFEGVAHYGLIPDFLQDLSNVGLKPQDLSALFRSAENVAQMWSKCLLGAYAFQPHFYDKIVPAGNNDLLLTFTPAGEGYQLEESSKVADPSSWQAANVTEYRTNGLVLTIRVPGTAQSKFYRMQKQQ
jgi:microsomal dipeptidase-like Zn-dependent dipeptidase